MDNNMANIVRTLFHDCANCHADVFRVSPADRARPLLLLPIYVQRQVVRLVHSDRSRQTLVLSDCQFWCLAQMGRVLRYSTISLTLSPSRNSSFTPLSLPPLCTALALVMGQEIALLCILQFGIENDMDPKSYVRFPSAESWGRFTASNRRAA